VLSTNAAAAAARVAPDFALSFIDCIPFYILQCVPRPLRILPRLGEGRESFESANEHFDGAAEAMVHQAVAIGWR